MERIYEDNDEIQIDLLELLEALRRRIWLILLALILGGGAGVLYTKMLITPLYTSTATVYVLSKETTLTSLADLQIGSQLTNDYRVMVTSRPVLEEVIENLGLETDYLGLRRQLKLENPSDTRMLSIAATDSDPQRAKMIVDEVASVSSEYIGDIMEMVPPKMIEDGVVPSAPSSPSVKRNGAVCGVLLAAVVCGVICLQVILNDTIRTEEDVARYLGLTVLAAIPKEGGEPDKGAYDRHGRYEPAQANNVKLEQTGRERKSRRKQSRPGESKSDEGREKE